MRNSIPLWTIVIRALLAQGAIAHPDPASSARIRVALCDLTGLGAAQLEDVKTETAALFSPGAVILWSNPEMSCSEEPPSTGTRYARVFILDALLPSIQSFFPRERGDTSWRSRWAGVPGP